MVDVSALSDQVRCPARRGRWARVLLAGLVIGAATGWPTPAYAVAAGQLSIIAGNGVAGSTPATAPAAPTGLSATPGNASATLIFTPGSDGGSAVTGYQVSTDGGDHWTTLATSPGAGATRTGTVTGLTNGIPYSVKVRAVNSVGTGAPSAAASVTPATAPAAPTGLSATPGNASATLSFTPGSDGGSAVTGYQVSTDGGDHWTTLATSPGAGATRPGPVTGLTNGIPYSVKVRAVNSVGTGAPSAAASVTPAATAPAAPTGLSATPGNASATVTFTAPSDGGSAVTGYEYSTDGTTWHPLTTTTSGSTETGTITDLINGTTYQVAVRAVNSVGTGAPSAAASVTPAATAPAAPTGLSATPGNASATVTFTAPSDGGSAVTGYEYSTDGTTWHPLTTTTTSGSTETGTVTGLTNGTPYSVKVRAVNGCSTGAPS